MKPDIDMKDCIKTEPKNRFSMNARAGLKTWYIEPDYDTHVTVGLEKRQNQCGPCSYGAACREDENGANML